MILSAGMFHAMLLSNRGRSVYVQTVRVRRWMMQDGKKRHNSSICIHHIGYYKCIYWKGRSSTSGITSDCSLLPHSTVLLSGPSADITIPGAGRNRLSLLLAKWCGPHALLCILTTSPWSLFSTVCLYELNPWSAKWTFAVDMCVCQCVLLAALPIYSLVLLVGNSPHAVLVEVSPSFLDWLLGKA